MHTAKWLSYGIFSLQLKLQVPTSNQSIVLKPSEASLIPSLLMILNSSQGFIMSKLPLLPTLNFYCLFINIIFT